MNQDQQIISRKDAQAAGLKRYFTGEECSNGHVSDRRVGNGECYACAKLRLNKWREDNPDKKAAHRKKHKELNREKENLQHRLWLNADPDRKEKYRLQKNQATLNWQKLNPAKKREQIAEYRAQKDQRMPSWLNQGHMLEIESVYSYCKALNSIGLKYHVDHVVPLRGKNVSGLHAPWNLQVIPALENIRKNNSWEVNHA